MKALRADIAAVGHVELRNHLPEVMSRLTPDEPALALTSRNRIEAILLSPAVFNQLAAAEEERDRILAALPVLVAAASTGVAFPSETLRGLVGSELSLDWQRMNAFQASFPLTTTHDEEGHVLTPAPVNLDLEPVVALDDELRYL